jgi:hypothetical protein
MESGNNMDTPPAFSIKAMLQWVGFFAAILATFLLFLLLGDKPFGVQTVSFVGGTVFVFYLVFCDTYWWHGYGLRNKVVQKELPRLLGIHSLFLVLIFSVLTSAISARPHLPSSWLVERSPKDHSFFSLGLIGFGAIILVTEAWICRRILRRAFEADDPLRVPPSQTNA